MPLSFDECVQWMKGVVEDSGPDIERAIWVDNSAVVTYRRCDVEEVYINYYNRSDESDARFASEVNRLVIDEDCEDSWGVFDEVCEDIGKWGHHYEL